MASMRRDGGSPNKKGRIFPNIIFNEGFFRVFGSRLVFLVVFLGYNFWKTVVAAIFLFVILGVHVVSSQCLYLSCFTRRINSLYTEWLCFSTFLMRLHLVNTRKFGLCEHSRREYVEENEVERAIFSFFTFWCRRGYRVL